MVIQTKWLNLNVCSVMANGIIHNVSAKAMKPTKPKPNPKPDPKPEPDVTFPINIKKASYEDLQEITGVGLVIAQRIMYYRKKTPFKKKTDLKNVKGIGPATYEKMKNQITI